MSAILKTIRAVRNASDVKERGAKAHQWMRRFIGNLYEPVGVDTRSLLISPKNKNTNRVIGELYMYRYDPKHKKTLPYYDTFPMVFVIELYKNGFLGLNIHYLPPAMRAKLMIQLEKLASDSRYTDKTKLKISYEIIKQTSSLGIAQPCVKRYLTTHIRSNVIRVPPEDWVAAVFLPVAKFKKASQEAVWAESRKIARKHTPTK